jgi:acetyltransferase-like isoleucine patch superfamily enzyme
MGVCDVLYRVPGLRGVALRIQRLFFRLIYGGRLGHGVRVFGWPIISAAPGSHIAVGEDVVMVSHSYFSEVGVGHPCILRTLRPGAEICVGDHVGMSGATLCAAISVDIGAGTMLGANCLVTDSDLHTLGADRRYATADAEADSVRIGSNVFVGANAIILKGVTIGDDAVVGAGAVVTADVGPGSIVAGVPARVVGHVSGSHGSEGHSEAGR